ncbi:hypothetical protein GCM10027269_37200 [Kribbella endophytica]
MPTATTVQAAPVGGAERGVWTGGGVERWWASVHWTGDGAHLGREGSRRISTTQQPGFGGSGVHGASVVGEWWEAAYCCGSSGEQFGCVLEADLDRVSRERGEGGPVIRG